MSSYNENIKNKHQNKHLMSSIQIRRFLFYFRTQRSTFGFVFCIRMGPQSYVKCQHVLKKV